MRCPKCGEIGGQTKRTEHRKDKDGWSMVFRERKCANTACGHIFPTYECYEYAEVEVVMRMRDALALGEQMIDMMRQIDREARPMAMA